MAPSRIGCRRAPARSAISAVEDGAGWCRPLIGASTLGSSRWASTGGASCLDVVGEHVVAALHRGRAPWPRAPGAASRAARRRAAARRNARVAAVERDGVALHGLGDVTWPTMPISLRISAASVTGSRSSSGLRCGVRVEHRDLGGLDRVAHRHPRHEAVALRLGQGVGALHLDRVLGRDHHERRLEVVRRVVDGDLPLLHALQQRGLGLGRGAVDLVADHDVGEDAARPELELAGLLVEDRDAGDVGRAAGRA